MVIGGSVTTALLGSGAPWQASVAAAIATGLGRVLPELFTVDSDLDDKSIGARDQAIADQVPQSQYLVTPNPVVINEIVPSPQPPSEQPLSGVISSSVPPVISVPASQPQSA